MRRRDRRDAGALTGRAGTKQGSARHGAGRARRYSDVSSRRRAAQDGHPQRLDVRRRARERGRAHLAALPDGDAALRRRAGHRPRAAAQDVPHPRSRRGDRRRRPRAGADGRVGQGGSGARRSARADRAASTAALRRRSCQLWDAYEAAASPEARLAKGLDKLETILQHTQGETRPTSTTPSTSTTADDTPRPIRSSPHCAPAWTRRPRAVPGTADRRALAGR